MDQNRDNENRADDAKEVSAPPRLIAALQRAQATPIFVPRTVDEAVLRAARQHLAPAKPSRDNLFTGWLRWLSFAAVCVFVATVSQRFFTTNTSSRPVALREDLNRDGQVDILDALRLAQQLQAGAKANPVMDVNGDSVVDQADADAIATQAVKLEKGGHS